MRNLLGHVSAIARHLRSAVTVSPSRSAGRPARQTPDLSGDWAPDRARGGMGQSLSLSDPGGRKRGKRGRHSRISRGHGRRRCPRRHRPGPNQQFDETTDPQVIYCEPPGVPHIYLWPIKTRFVPTPEAVYLLLRARSVLPRGLAEQPSIPRIPIRSGGDTRSATTRTATRSSSIRSGSTTRRGSIRWAIRTPSSCISSSATSG